MNEMCKDIAGVMEEIARECYAREIYKHGLFHVLLSIMSNKEDMEAVMQRFCALHTVGKDACSQVLTDNR